MQKLIVSGIESVDNYPTIPDTLMRAMNISNDPEASLQDFADVVKNDPMLVAAFLKRANSSLYGGGRLSDIHQAVVRIGFRDCGKMITALGMLDMFGKLPKDAQE